MLQGLVPTLRLRRVRGGKQVGGVEPAHVDLVRLAGLEGVQRQVGMHGGMGERQGGVLLGADARLPVVRVDFLAGVHAPLAHEAVGRAHGQAARNVQVARDGRDVEHGLAGLDAVRLLVGGQTQAMLPGWVVPM